MRARKKLYGGNIANDGFVLTLGIIGVNQWG